MDCLVSPQRVRTVKGLLESRRTPPFSEEKGSLRPILELFGTLLAPSWFLLGLSWAPFGSTWAALGLSWTSLFGALGPICGASCGPWRPKADYLGSGAEPPGISSILAYFGLCLPIFVISMVTEAYVSVGFQNCTEAR